MFVERLDQEIQRLTEENKTFNDRLQALEQQQQRPAGSAGILKEKCDEQGESATEAGGQEITLREQQLRQAASSLYGPSPLLQPQPLSAPAPLLAGRQPSLLLPSVENDRTNPFRLLELGSHVPPVSL